MERSQLDPNDARTTFPQARWIKGWHNFPHLSPKNAAGRSVLRKQQLLFRSYGSFDLRQRRLDIRADFSKAGRIFRLATKHQHRSSVGGSHQAPSTRKFDPRPIDGNYRIKGLVVLARAADDLELDVVWAINANFWRIVHNR